MGQEKTQNPAVKNSSGATDHTARIVKILDQQIALFEGFKKLTLDFAQALKRGGFERMGSFQLSREKIIREVDSLDTQLTSEAQRVRTLMTTSQSEIIIERAETKDALVSEIVACDATVLEMIENEQKRLQREIFESRENKNSVGRFKSKWVKESGKGLDSEV